MQDYLNRAQIESYAVLRTAEKRLHELLGSAHQMTKAEAEQYRRTLTHLCKATTLTVERLDRQFAKAIIATADFADIAWVRSTPRFITENKEPEKYSFTASELDDALDKMLSLCKECSGDSTCRLRFFLLQACVPEFNTENPICPYAQVALTEVSDDKAL